MTARSLPNRWSSVSTRVSLTLYFLADLLCPFIVEEVTETNSPPVGTGFGNTAMVAVVAVGTSVMEESRSICSLFM